nr:protein FAR1-RELATED SEQUENCE 5-like [Arachis hypogaea]
MGVVVKLRTCSTLQRNGTFKDTGDIDIVISMFRFVAGKQQVYQGKKEVAQLLPIDFDRSFNSEGKDSVGSASNDSRGHYSASDDEYDDDDYLECNEGRESGEKMVGGADDGNGWGDANDAAEVGLRRPVVATDFLGKEFATEDDAYAAYKEFAKSRGFGVRKGDIARVNGVLIRRDFFCHRQGTRHAKHYDRPERVREERLESRTDCKAKLKIYYDMQHSVWRVRTIVDEHNHELAPAVFARLIRSHRKMSDGDKAQVDSLKQFGIATSKIMAYMAGQSGGYGMLRFTKRDLYNYVHGQRVARICDGDAAATISYLEGKANADMRTVARYTRTSDNRLGSLIWADGEMITDYHLFGDVLAFDSTYRSNKYKKPLVVFSGSNHHKQTSIFGFVLLKDEEVRTYRWVLLNLLDVMGQKNPCVVVTDGDKAMRTAIAEVMPTATHRLCGWHLEKNCVQRVKDPEFRKVFRKAIYANFEISEFEEYWKASVESLGLEDNSWVKSTYESSESWAMAYLRGTFCAGYRTTSRCEGINAFVKGFLKSTDSILELVHSLDRVVKDYRNNEVIAQFHSTYYSSVLTTGLDSIERFASKVYTRAVFREVKKQIKAVATLLFRAKDSISTTTVYTFSRMGKPNRTHKVLVDPNEGKIECECSMWNSEGIPCSHIFCAMKYEGFEEIPPGLVLRRWSKDAKDCRLTAADSKDGSEGRLLRYGALCGAMSLVAQLGSEDAAEFVVARDGIASLTKTLQQRFVDKVGSKLGLSPVSGIEDPVVSKTKGAPRKGKECVPISQGERTPKRRRCTNCGEASHTKRTCTWHPGEGVAGNDDAGGPSYMEHDSQDAAAPCATPEARHCHTNEVGMQSESGNHGDTVPAHADGTNPCIGVGGGGPNFFLGGQHIEQFYSANSCSGHTGQQSSQAPCPRLRNPSAWTNEEWFERWMTQGQHQFYACNL